MNFELDKQTILDLEIFGHEKGSISIFRFYNLTKTIGGKKYLFDLMQSPLTDIHKLQQRRDTIKFIYDIKFNLTINSSQFDFIEHYLNLNRSALRNNFLDAYVQSISYKLKPLNDYYIIQSGIQQLIFLFKHLEVRLNSIINLTLPKEFGNRILQIQSFFECHDIKEILTANEKISCIKLNRFDNLLRKKYKKEVHEIIQIVYIFDSYISIAQAARKNKFSFPEYLTASGPRLSITGLFHPFIENAVPYNVEINETKSMSFVTGPNMAGKSTFLKSLGLSIYLSHLGFPVPATQMKTTVYNGIISTINLSDNMNRGYSHFYSEVKRIKETALKIKEKGNIFVIFDELFRGTNVKDAYDASLIIIKSFSKITSSTFYISTHITEVASEIETIKNIQFMYFNSELVDNQPIYNYKLLVGVSHERLGMLIVKNENIIEILNSISDTE